MRISVCPSSVGVFSRLLYRRYYTYSNTVLIAIDYTYSTYNVYHKYDTNHKEWFHSYLRATNFLRTINQHEEHTDDRVQYRTVNEQE